MQRTHSQYLMIVKNDRSVKNKNNFCPVFSAVKLPQSIKTRCRKFKFVIIVALGHNNHTNQEVIDQESSQFGDILQEGRVS